MTAEDKRKWIEAMSLLRTEHEATIADLRAEAAKLRQERDALRDLVSGERREAEGGIEFCGLCGGYHPLGNKSFVGRIFDNPCTREEKGGA